jgi:hypothetical protein
MNAVQLWKRRLILQPQHDLGKMDDAIEATGCSRLSWATKWSRAGFLQANARYVKNLDV